YLTRVFVYLTRVFVYLTRVSVYLTGVGVSDGVLRMFKDLVGRRLRRVARKSTGALLRFTIPSGGADRPLAGEPDAHRSAHPRTSAPRRQGRAPGRLRDGDGRLDPGGARGHERARRLRRAAGARAGPR